MLRSLPVDYVHTPWLLSDDERWQFGVKPSKSDVSLVDYPSRPMIELETWAKHYDRRDGSGSKMRGNPQEKVKDITARFRRLKMFHTHSHAHAHNHEHHHYHHYHPTNRNGTSRTKTSAAAIPPRPTGIDPATGAFRAQRPTSRNAPPPMDNSVPGYPPQVGFKHSQGGLSSYSRSNLTLRPGQSSNGHNIGKPGACEPVGRAPYADGLARSVYPPYAMPSSVRTRQDSTHNILGGFPVDCTRSRAPSLPQHPAHHQHSSPVYHLSQSGASADAYDVMGTSHAGEFAIPPGTNLDNMAVSQHS